MSLRTFIDNVVILAIENCLISELPTVLEPNMVRCMDDEKIVLLVAERPGVAERRKQLDEEVLSVRHSLEIYERHRLMEPPKGMSSLLPLFGKDIQILTS